MKKIKLCVPMNLEQECCLALKFSSDMSFLTNSKEQHQVEYYLKHEEGVGDIEEITADNLLDAKSDMQITMNNFKVYITNHK